MAIPSWVVHQVQSFLALLPNIEPAALGPRSPDFLISCDASNDLLGGIVYPWGHRQQVFPFQREFSPDENGEHIQTVEEAKLEAQAMQNMLDEGVANVDKKIEQRNIMMAQEEAAHKDEPVKQEEDDGHIETVEEVKAKMKALSENMNNDLAAVN